MNIITIDDINYLAQQSSGRINMILSGMMALMNDTDSKVEMVQSQGWFQRMIKTVTGKNKLTQLEIQQNHDKLNAYMSEAIAELYNRHCIDHEIMMSLGTQLNELYADHLQLKQMLGAFVSKLNEKIDSVDNFHMLTTEISQGVYSYVPSIVAICKVISQFDNRILEDSRKLDILKRSLISQNIISNKEFCLTDYLMNIVDVPVEEMGQIYLELSTIRSNFMANILLGIMEKYHFLPDMARKMKNKKNLIDEVISDENLEGSIALSINEIYDDFINSKIDVKHGLIPITEVQIDSKLEEAEKLYLECKLGEAFELFKALAEKGNGRAMYFMGEYYAQSYGPVVKDSDESKKWRQRGYELGDVLSSLNVAYSLPKECDERREVFNRMFEPILKLAESGDVFAQNELADLYGGGYGVKEDEEKEIYWLKKSAQNGFWHSMNKLGDLYEEKKDYLEAMKWYKKAAEQGYVIAQYNIGTLYYSGDGVEQDYQKAIYWIRQAAEQGYSSAENELALCYDNGVGVEVDQYEAFKWYKKAAEHGLAVGQNNLASCYEHGEGTEKDIKKAKEWYEKAFENGCDDAATQIGILAQNEGDYTEAVKWYRKAAENGEADAQNRLGVRYDNGQGVIEDKEEALKWFMKAAEQGHMKAQANVGSYYYHGYVVDSDDEKAKEWLRKSAEQGWETAITWLSEWYNEGEGTISESVQGNSPRSVTKVTLDSIKASCELFVMFHDGAKYDATYKLKNNFGILYEDVYLGHDDTLFKSGKNGFAITEYGIYCRDMMASYTNHISFEQLASTENIYINGSNIYADQELIAYITGSTEEKEDVKSLFEQIRLFVQVDLW